MQRFIISIGAVLAFLAAPVLASAQPAHQDSKKVDLQITKPMVVGTTTLAPGDYKVQCKLIDGQHMLVVTSANDGREVARVPCTPETLAQKPETTQFRSVTRPDGSVVLSAVRIRGDLVAHKVTD